MGEVLNGPLGEVFDSQQLLTDVSGSGNNWCIHRNISDKSMQISFTIPNVLTPTSIITSEKCDTSCRMLGYSPNEETSWSVTAYYIS